MRRHTEQQCDEMAVSEQMVSSPLLLKHSNVLLMQCKTHFQASLMQLWLCELLAKASIVYFCNEGRPWLQPAHPVHDQGGLLSEPVEYRTAAGHCRSLGCLHIHLVCRRPGILPTQPVEKQQGSSALSSYSLPSKSCQSCVSASGAEGPAGVAAATTSADQVAENYVTHPYKIQLNPSLLRLLAARKLSGGTRLWKTVCCFPVCLAQVCPAEKAHCKGPFGCCCTTVEPSTVKQANLHGIPYPR